MKIIDTTDGLYIGQEIDPSHLPIVLGDDVSFYPDHIVRLENGFVRLYNTNYVIDAKE